MRTTITDTAQTTIAAFSLFVMVLGLVIKYRLEIRQWIMGCWTSNTHNAELPHLEEISVDSLELAESHSGEHASLLEGSSLLQRDGDITTAVASPEAVEDGINRGLVHARALEIARRWVKVLEDGVGKVRRWF
ncbi:hypothetical protein K440DRAFT_679726 [Wilcoxina mikolae CBS 423.85]|nr:hypothetical protein K440DRAFT_679726 [Wilcoxina mikolae CBS 423.85]